MLGGSGAETGGFIEVYYESIRRFWAGNQDFNLIILSRKKKSEKSFQKKAKKVHF
jgi:hypothetical protein